MITTCIFDGAMAIGMVNGAGVCGACIVAEQKRLYPEWKTTDELRDKEIKVVG